MTNTFFPEVTGPIPFEGKESKNPLAFKYYDRNRKVGGKGKSMHLSCRAVDFRVHGSSRGLIQYLSAQKEVGGLNRYPSGFYHIDNGPRRTW